MKLMILAVVMCLAVGGGSAAAADAAAGKAVYDTKCKSCHGAEGQGNPGIAKMLKVTLRHLGSKEIQAKTDDEIKKTIAAGSGKMKPVELSAKQVGDVIAFVRTLKP